MTTTAFIQNLVLSDKNIDHGIGAPPDILATDLGTRAIFSRKSPPTAKTKKPPQAMVDAGSLLSFVDGVNSQEQDDVLYAIQLAQRGASGAYNRFTQTRQWYGKYVGILEQLGWTVEQMAFTRHDQSEGEVRMDQASLAVIAAIPTQNQLAVLKESVTALTSLAEEDGTIRLFDFHTLSEMSGNFQIGAVQKMTLNTDLYAGHRDLVREKLGAAAADFISALALG